MTSENVEKTKADADAKESEEKTKADANAKVVTDMDKAQVCFMEERAEKTKAEEKKHWGQFWKC